MLGLSVTALFLLQILLSSYLSTQTFSYGHTHLQLPEHIEKTLERSVKSFQARVAYGKPAPIEKFPYFASLDHCGATIISDKWVVTAAHCVHKLEFFTTSVWVGGNSIINSKKVPIDKIVIHPMFDLIKNDFMIHDIALIKLKDPLTFDDKVQPIDLPEEVDNNVISHFYNWYFSDRDEDIDDDPTELSEESVDDNDLKNRYYEGLYYDDPLVLVGRGMDETSRPSKKLMQMNLNRLPLGICFDLLYTNSYSRLKNFMPLLNEFYFCGVRVENLLGIGPGDSGSPVAKDNKLVGIVSFAMNPGNVRVGFFVNVAPYVSWIKSVIDM